MRYRVSVANGRGSLKHNRRDFYAENVDKARTKNNVVLCDKSIDEAYQEAFGEAIEEYNRHQRQACRKLTVKKYRQKIEQGQGKENNPKLFYETIIQVGDMETAGIKDNPKTAEEMKQVLIEYFKDFQERTNGHMVIVGAYIHMDEATPHMHIDWIPTARGYKKGMQVRNSLEKAMKEMGHVAHGKQGKRHNNRAVWQDFERDRLCEIARKRGIEAIWEKHDTPEKHVDTETYRKKIARAVTRKAEEIADVIEEETARKVQNVQKMGWCEALAHGKERVATAQKGIVAQQVAIEQALKAEYESRVLDLEKREERATIKEKAQKNRDIEQDTREQAIEKKEQDSIKRQAMRDAELTAKEQEISRKLAEDQRVRDETARLHSEISTKEANAKAYNDDGWEALQDAEQMRKANEKERQALEIEKTRLKPIQEANEEAEKERKRADGNAKWALEYRNRWESEQQAHAETKANAEAKETAIRREYDRKEHNWSKFSRELQSKAEVAEAQNKMDAETLKAKDQAMEALKNTVEALKNTEKNLNGYINAMRNELDCIGTVIDEIKDNLPVQVRAFLKAYRNQSENARAATSHGDDFPSITPSAEDVKRIEKELSKPRGVKRHQSHGRDTGR